MSLYCPECGHRLETREILKFLRFHSIGCPQCKLPVALDDRGRSAFTISLVLTILIGVLVAAVTGSELAALITAIAALVGASLAGARYGKLVGSKEDSDSNKKI